MSNPSVIALDYFISGLLPTISKRVKQLLPETYSAAEGYAFQIECENLSSQAKKNEFLNSVWESTRKDDQNLEQFNERIFLYFLTYMC